MRARVMNVLLDSINGPCDVFNEMMDFSCRKTCVLDSFTPRFSLAVGIDESPVVYQVQIKSGFSSLNDTADVLLTLIGEDTTDESILLTCDSDTKPFQTGQLDTFYLSTKNLGKVSRTAVMHLQPAGFVLVVDSFGGSTVFQRNDELQMVL